jgi:hypothetical protein
MDWLAFAGGVMVGLTIGVGIASAIVVHIANRLNR